MVPREPDTLHLASGFGLAGVSPENESLVIEYPRRFRCSGLGVNLPYPTHDFTCIAPIHRHKGEHSG